MTDAITRQLAEEINAQARQIQAAVALLDDGATVPFIARYRKEVTGGLDDGQLRQLEERLRYLRELAARRDTIVASIEEQGKLTPALATDIQAADTKSRLEDLYLPYKPKRRSKAQTAREAGLEPLADALFEDPTLDPHALAAAYLKPDQGIADGKAALDGARQILMERFSEDATLLDRLRRFMTDESLLASRLMEGKAQDGAKFSDYFEHTEKLSRVPSHRALAMFRGRQDGILSLQLQMSEEETPSSLHPCEAMLAAFWRIDNQGRPADRWLAEVVRWTWRVKLLPQLQSDLLNQLRERAEQEAIDVFAANLKDLLLAAPAGARATIGLDPGLRTGVKLAVVDATGKVVDHGAIFPNPPQKRLAEAEATLLAMIAKHDVGLIAIGNGTASRETERFVAAALTRLPGRNIQRVVVNEAGASVYSASELAAREFPELDVTVRGAVSIARRLQDPLAELVKIDPKAIGVGQYQHDVSQAMLARRLGSVVEDCVNAVGVDVNTASAPLLTRVSGLSPRVADNIVAYRDQQGRFTRRRDFLKVSGLGDKTYEQAAGFLRIADGSNPLDASAVHPESYPVVEKIAAAQRRGVDSIIGDSRFLRSLNPADYTGDGVGLPTVTDILAELDKPGRDPRPAFRTAAFREGIESISDLREDMVLEGTVTNVTGFGAFVDIGVHQDGLVHISALSDSFVKDPRTVVKAGDIVKVKVMAVDLARKRIGLSMRLGDSAEQHSERDKRGTTNERRPRGSQSQRRGRKPDGPDQPQAQGALAAAFAKARQK